MDTIVVAYQRLIDYGPCMHTRLAVLILSAVLATANFTACSGGGAATDSSSTQLTPKQVAATAEVLIDVRSPEEFSAGHLDRAENIPVDQVEAKVDVIASKVGGDKSKQIVVYCASGGRSGRAKTTLEKAGFTNVINAGGYKDLR